MSTCSCNACRCFYKTEPGGVCTFCVGGHHSGVLKTKKTTLVIPFPTLENCKRMAEQRTPAALLIIAAVVLLSQEDNYSGMTVEAIYEKILHAAKGNV